MSKLTLGLDIGIASVGWGLIDEETGSIVDCGVRIFEAGSADNNVERRTNRQARRLTRRKKHRRDRIDQLLEKYGVDRPEFTGELNPYELRVRGLNEKLSNEELYIALFNLAKRRGISYLDDAADDGEIKSEPLKLNQLLLENQHPCQIQLERFNKHGQLRGVFPISNEDGGVTEIVNIFTTSKYAEEAKAILLKQQELGNVVDDLFIDEYIKILTKKRDYFTGPGNELSRTDYGIYKTNGDTLENLFEILIGKCTIYPKELRAARASYTAQKFNLLNDLNNLTISGEKLAYEQKQEIIAQILDPEKKTVSVINIIKKVTGCTEDEIKGARIDKKEKMEFHSFETFRRMRKEFIAEGLDTEVLSREVCDELAYVLTLNTETQAIKEGIRDRISEDVVSDEMIAVLTRIKKKNSGLFSKWHSLSIKAMNEIIPELHETSKNQMQIFSELGVFNKRLDSLKASSKIPVDMITDEIYNPVVKRSIRQTIKIVNTLIKKYGDLNAIVIEMPRDDNPDEQKKKITNAQKKNVEEKDAAILRAKSEYGLTSEDFRGKKDLMPKIRMWYQQECRCIYSNKPISIDDLVNRPNLFDIDHIIPKSISFDDSQGNKVLCYAEFNRLKGNKTPFAYFKSATKDFTYSQFKANVMELFKKNKITKKKKDFLLEEADITKWEVRQGFISRNLNDTRYSSKVVLNTLQDFMKVNEKETKLYVIRGQFTSQLRRKWDLTKNRDESFSHHGVDALVVAGANKLKLWEKGSIYAITSSGVVDKETGEILPEMNSDEYDDLVYKEPFANFIVELVEHEKTMKISHKVDRKVNRGISDATIYSTRKIDETDYVVGKLSNIYEDKVYETFKKRYDKNKEQFLMCRHDLKTFEILEKVMETYADQKNPFRAYKEEHGEPIRKYSKKGNGPFVFDLKYVDVKLGKHINLSDKAMNSAESDKKVVLLSLKPFRTDVYYNAEKGQYHLVGIKRDMFKFQRDKYVLDMGAYQNEKENVEKLDEGYEFMFSLYKNDIVRWKEEGSDFENYRFLSKCEGAKNKVEVKPVVKPKFEKQSYKTITKKIILFQKISTDILGNQHIISKEKFNTEFEL